VAADDKYLLVDYFPEDKLRIMALRDAAPIVAWIDYHRSRIRLARSLAVYGPGLVLASTVGFLRYSVDDSALVAVLTSAGIVALYASWGRLGALPGAPPRTDSLKLIAYARNRDWLENGNVKRFERDSAAHGDRAVWAEELKSLSVPIAMLVLAAGFAIFHASRLWDEPPSTAAAPLLIVVAGAIAVWLCAWAWWRISETYRSYLYHANRFGKTS
jgi:hypothetical protein